MAKLRLLWHLPKLPPLLSIPWLPPPAAPSACSSPAPPDKGRSSSSTCSPHSSVPPRPRLWSRPGTRRRGRSSKPTSRCCCCWWRRSSSHCRKQTRLESMEKQERTVIIVSNMSFESFSCASALKTSKRHVFTYELIHHVGRQPPLADNNVSALVLVACSKSY